MKILGIDLGTSNTYIYGAHRHSVTPQPVVLPRASAPDGCVETVILYEDDIPRLIGHLAESEYYANAALRPRRSLRCQFKPETGEDASGAARWMTDFLRMLREALPPNTVSRWLMLGARGTVSTTCCNDASTTVTCMAWDRGMCWCR